MIIYTSEPVRLASGRVGVVGLPASHVSGAVPIVIRNPSDISGRIDYLVVHPQYSKLEVFVLAAVASHPEIREAAQESRLWQVAQAEIAFRRNWRRSPLPLAEACELPEKEAVEMLAFPQPPVFASEDKEAGWVALMLNDPHIPVETKTDVVAQIIQGGPVPQECERFQKQHRIARLGFARALLHSVKRYPRALLIHSREGLPEDARIIINLVAMEGGIPVSSPMGQLDSLAHPGLAVVAVREVRGGLQAGFRYCESVLMLTENSAKFATLLPGVSLTWQKQGALWVKPLAGEGVADLVLSVLLELKRGMT